MSLVTVRQCKCDNHKIFLAEYQNEPLTVFCENCIKDSAITNGAIKITNTVTGKEVNLAKL